MVTAITKTERLKCQQPVDTTMWSDTEVERLTEMYATTPNSVIAEELSRSKSSVKSKAQRLGLSKDQTASRMYDTRKKPAKYPVSDDEFANYICGFVDGEGSFNYTHDKTGYIMFRFAIELVEADREILESIRDFLGVGTIYDAESRDDSWQDKVQYTVYDADSLARTIIPFFKHYGLRAEQKQAQFEEFSEQFHDYHGIEPKDLYQ